MKLTKNEVAEARIFIALSEIEKAQSLLDAACRAISAIPGLAALHRRIALNSDRCKSTWYSLDHRVAVLRKNDGPIIDREVDEHYDGEYVEKAGARRAFGNA